MAAFDLDLVKSTASTRWADILSQLGGIPHDSLDGGHHPCPKCGGSDRWRFFADGTGGGICNQCCRSGGDGFAILQWFTGKPFAECLQLVAEFVNVKPSANGGPHGKSDADPAKHLEFLPWDDLAAAYWCLKKPPITVESMKSCGARIARYRGEWMVFAFPIYGQNLQIVGWCIYSSGGLLPKWTKDAAGKLKTSWVKVKLTYGSSQGLMGPFDRLADSAKVWKLEGLPDVMAMLTLVDLPGDTIPITNSNGAKEKPLDWVLDKFRGKLAFTCHDADKPGQDGAIGWDDEQGRFRPGWATMLSTTAAGSRNVKLPYPITPDHGHDVRDWIASGKTFAHFLELVTQSPLIDPATVDNSPSPLEEDNDPHRLARINLKRYSQCHPGATLRYWRGEWYTWKPERGCYRRIEASELRARITESIKQEFDRLNLYQQKNRDPDKPPPKSLQVGGHLVNNVLNATASTCLISDSIEPMTWLHADGKRERRNLIAMENGLIDIDKLLADADESECVLPHSAEWFSLVRLPYKFDKFAKCPKWEAFLEKNLELDAERIKILQEWAGYCLLPDTGYQKFLVLEGEGANGKSVYCAGISALIGMENCSHIPLEVFGDRFSKTATIGKLLNVCADVGEMDKAAEGYLKSFTSGDTMHFDRKGIAGIDCVPSARLVMACNNRPRFSDRSSGIWRRMILIPWNIQITEKERTPNMDKAWWWQQSCELPGMFIWALKGLARLRHQGRFTESEVMAESIEDYQEDINPAKSFLKDHFEKSDGSVKSQFVYSLYARWCEHNGYRALGERMFGKEVKRCLPFVNRVYGGEKKNRYWQYEGIVFSVDEICGMKTWESNLF